MTDVFTYSRFWLGRSYCKAREHTSNKRSTSRYPLLARLTVYGTFILVVCCASWVTSDIGSVPPPSSQTQDGESSYTVKCFKDLITDVFTYSRFWLGRSCCKARSYCEDEEHTSRKRSTKRYSFLLGWHGCMVCLY